MKKEKSEEKTQYDVWYLLKDRKFYLFFSNIVNILATASSVICSLVMVEQIQALFAGDFKTAFNFAVLELFLFTLSILFGFWFDILKNNMIKTAMLKYRQTISFNLEKESEAVETNAYISALNNDSKQVEASLNCFFNTVDSLTGMILAFLGLVKIHFYIACSAIVLFILNVLASKIFKKKSIENEKNRSEILEEYYSETSDKIQGYDIWNLYNAKRYMKNKLDRLHKDFEERMNVIHNWTSLFQYAPSLFNIWAQMFQYLFLIFLISKGIVVPGTAFAVGNLSGQFFSHMMSFIKEFIQISGFNSIINEKMSSERGLDDTLEEVNQYDITIKNLSFGYENRPIFKGFNLSLPYGKKVVITGSSGSGKSTLVHILAKKIKLYEGEVYLGNRNIKEMNDYTLHAYVGFMSQKPYIFSESIKDNITLGKEEQIAIGDVVNGAYIHEFAEDLDKKIENNGENYSGGQLQRIAIARELYSPHPIMIFDESVSALDPKNTKRVLNHILSLKSTVILVAHRLPDEILKNFDKVIDIDQEKSFYSSEIK